MTDSLTFQSTVFLYIKFYHEFVDLMVKQTGVEVGFFIFR